MKQEQHIIMYKDVTGSLANYHSLSLRGRICRFLSFATITIKTVCVASLQPKLITLPLSSFFGLRRFAAAKTHYSSTFLPSQQFCSLTRGVLHCIIALYCIVVSYCSIV